VTDSGALAAAAPKYSVRVTGTRTILPGTRRRPDYTLRPGVGTCNMYLSNVASRDLATCRGTHGGRKSADGIVSVIIVGASVMLGGEEKRRRRVMAGGGRIRRACSLTPLKLGAGPASVPGKFTQPKPPPTSRRFDRVSNGCAATASAQSAAVLMNVQAQMRSAAPTSGEDNVVGSRGRLSC
jgi:hypothetical protein